MVKIQFKQPFVEQFPGDESYNLMQRQTPGKLYALVNPIGFPKAELIDVNKELALQFGIEKPYNQTITDIFNGNISNDVTTYATAYSGHQFGNWAGQLGDGRAIFLGEIIDKNQKPWELQYKGAGATPYSRRGDGRAVLRSTIREYLMSEAMCHLGIPTTRALSISLTGEDVLRDIMYDGNAAYEKGAVMIRAAESFLRFGHFEFLNANGDKAFLKQLTDWTIQRYYPEIKSKEKEKYIDFFRAVRNRTLEMIIHWYRVGFVHGVMNTDNMSILGLTIDYGPFAMLEEYDLQFTSNTTDLPGRRYAFGQQAHIALWNLNALANALFTLIQDVKPLQNILDEYENFFWQKFDQMMAQKLGLDSLQNDHNLLKEWQLLMLDLKFDYTLFFVELTKFHSNCEYNIKVQEISYQNITSKHIQKFDEFIQKYKQRIEQNTISRNESLGKMQQMNPQFILRNFQLYEATQAAEQGDFQLFLKLNKAIKTPYKNQFPELQQKRPDWADGVPGCSMLSCSS